MERGYEIEGLSYVDSLVSPTELFTLSDRARFVERVVEPQLSVATTIVAPHFFIADQGNRRPECVIGSPHCQ